MLVRRRRQWSHYEGEIKKLAHSLAVNPQEFEELVGEGAVAFVVAGHDFDPNRGVQFSTFLWWRALGAMKSYKRSQRKTPHLDADIDESVFGRTEADQEGTASFMQSLEGLSGEALGIIKCIFEAPAEMLGYTKSHGLSVRSLTAYLTKERGWKYQDVWDGVGEITSRLKGDKGC